MTFDGNSRPSPTKRIGLDKIAHELFAKDMKEQGIWNETARPTTRGLAMSYNDHAENAYEGVKKILHTRLAQVQKSLSKRKKKT